MQSYPGEINIGDCERVAPASLFFLIFFENLSEITSQGKNPQWSKDFNTFLL